MSSLSAAKNDQPRLSRGWRRMQEIAHESEAPCHRGGAIDRPRPTSQRSRSDRDRDIERRNGPSPQVASIGRNNTEQIRLIAQLLAYQNETSAAGACNSAACATL